MIISYLQSQNLKTRSITYNNTPSAHQSSVKSCPVPDIISGAIQNIITNQSLTQVLRCATKRVAISVLFLLSFDLCEAKVSEHYIPVRIYQYVFWFEISVNNLRVVQVTQGDRNLCGIELGLVLTETFCLHEMLQKFSTSIEN